MSEVPYKCGIDALVFLSLFDKAEKEMIKKRRKLTLENILIDVCFVQMQEPEMVKKPIRRRELVICKQLFYYTARQMTAYSFEYIGKFMGTDHTTVIYHSQTVTNFLRMKEPKWMKIWRHYTKESRLFTLDDFIQTEI